MNTGRVRRAAAQGIALAALMFLGACSCNSNQDTSVLSSETLRATVLSQQVQGDWVKVDLSYRDGERRTVEIEPKEWNALSKKPGDQVALKLDLVRTISRTESEVITIIPAKEVSSKSNGDGVIIVMPIMPQPPSFASPGSGK